MVIFYCLCFQSFCCLKKSYQFNSNEKIAREFKEKIKIYRDRELELKVYPCMFLTYVFDSANISLSLPKKKKSMDEKD